MLTRISQHFIIRGSIKPEISHTRELRLSLLPKHAPYDRPMQVMIGEESRSTHDA
jgi:hypothetical protein